jgi:membrane protease subunit HflK
MSDELDKLPADPNAPRSDDAGSQALSEAFRSSFFIVKLAMIALILVFLGSGFFMVGPQEKAVILRLGKLRGEGRAALLDPGLHWAFPAPIDEVRKIPFSEILSVESTVGWYFTARVNEISGSEPPPGPSLSPGRDGYAITGDSNIVHIRATLSYRVDDPIVYQFDFVNATNAVRDVLDNSILSVASEFKTDEILISDVARFQGAVQSRVAQLARRQNLGIVVDQCTIQSIAPRQLKQAFDNYTSAISERAALMIRTDQYTNYVITKARLDSVGITNSAQSERLQLVSSVKAEADRFTELLPRYLEDPDFFKNYLLKERIALSISNVSDKFFLPNRADGAKRDFRLDLTREPVKAKPAAPPVNNESVIQ